MNASWWRTPNGFGRSRTSKGAVRLAGAGGILGLITIIVSAVNIVSAQQAIELAVPAAILAIAGLARWVIPGRTRRS